MWIQPAILTAVFQGTSFAVLAFMSDEEWRGEGGGVGGQKDYITSYSNRGGV